MKVFRFARSSDCRARQLGMTLLEVLIALLVLSIGMVGLSALLVTALTNVHSSSQYSLASALALDFEERLWFEIATLSASTPGELSNGCLAIDQIENVAKEMVDQWTASSNDWSWAGAGAERFQVPELSIDVDEGDLSESEVNNADGEFSGIRWQKLESVTISWAEGRFDLDGGEDSIEIAIGLICRPIF